LSTASTTASGARPKPTLRPRDAADVAEIVATHPRALEPVGGGALRGVGHEMDADVLALDALEGLVAYEPEELVLTALAGTPLADIERELAARAQRLAFEPPDFDALLGVARPRTIGGAVTLAQWPVVWRISVPPTDAPRVLATLVPERYLLDWGGGLISAAFSDVDAARVRGALREGHATLFKAPPATRAANAVFQPQPAAHAAASRRVKQAFDPGGRLSPGRLG